MEASKLMEIKGDGFCAEVYDEGQCDGSDSPLGLVYVDIRKDGDASDGPFAEGFLGSSVASAYYDYVGDYEVHCNRIVDDGSGGHGLSEGDEGLWEAVRSWWRGAAKEVLDGLGETTEVEFSHAPLWDGLLVAKVGTQCGWTIDFFRKKDGSKVATLSSSEGFAIYPEEDATAKEIACLSGWLLKAATKGIPFPSMRVAMNVFGASKRSKEFSADVEEGFQARMADVRTDGQQ